MEILAAPPFSYLDTLNAVDDAIDKNAELSLAIWKAGLESFGMPPQVDILLPKDVVDWRGKATSNDLEKARSTLRQFYRDVSATIFFDLFVINFFFRFILHPVYSCYITWELDLLLSFASFTFKTL